MGSVTRRAVALLAAACATGCVSHPIGPARTHDKYVGKATTTAESAASQLRSLRLAALAGARDRAFGPYLAVVASDAEEALSGLQGTFASIQPPGEADDEVRDQLEPLLSDAVDHAANVRIAVRRGQLSTLEEMSRDLHNDARELDLFIEEQSR